MVFGPTVQFVCGECGASYEAGGSCRCAKKAFSLPTQANSYFRVKDLEFELKEAKTDRDDLLKRMTEMELLYAAEKEKLRFFEAALLRVKNMTVEELLKSFNGLSDKPSEVGMNFSLLEIE